MNYDLRTLVSDGPFIGQKPVKIHCVNEEHNDPEPSLAVFSENAYCFGCGKYWGAFDFAAELWGVDWQQARDRVRAGELPKAKVLPNPDVASIQELAAQVLTYHANLQYNPAARRYLNGRGLDDETIYESRIGYTGRAFAIPIYDKNRCLQTIRYRRDDNAGTVGPKYWGTAGRNQSFLYVPPLFDWRSGWRQACEADGINYDTVRPVVLCEGEFDALILAQAGVRAVSMTNGVNAFNEAHIPLFDNAPVWLCFDSDEPGRENMYRVTEILGTQCVGWSNVTPSKDTTEFALSSPGKFASWVRQFREGSTHTPSFAI